jgi:hypothetical protein
MVYWTEYIDFGIAAGFLNQNAESEKETATKFGKLKSNLKKNYNNASFKGLYVIDRTFM